LTVDGRVRRPKWQAGGSPYIESAKRILPSLDESFTSSLTTVGTKAPNCFRAASGNVCCQFVSRREAAKMAFFGVHPKKVHLRL
jgi:hypothetical protein